MKTSLIPTTGSAVVAMFLSLAGSFPAVAAEIVLDGRQTAHVFEGIGVLSAGASTRLLIDYPRAQRDEILDFLFKPKFGASIPHLKVEIGGDVNSTCGTEPSIARTRDEFLHPKPEYFHRGYEWWLTTYRTSEFPFQNDSPRRTRRARRARSRLSSIELHTSCQSGSSW
jgi:hypothetical protein